MQDRIIARELKRKRKKKTDRKEIKSSLIKEKKYRQSSFERPIKSFVGGFSESMRREERGEKRRKIREK